MTCVIAEAGTWHAGSVSLAHDLIKAARQAGANAIKFQMFSPEDEPVFCPLPGDEDRRARWRASALPLKAWKSLRFDTPGIDIIWSIFQKSLIPWLHELDPRYAKVALRARETFPYDQLPGPFLISVDPKQRPREIRGVYLPPRERCFYLQCRMSYPTPLRESRWTGVYDGLSDHSGTIWPAMDAICNGAHFIELHVRPKKADEKHPDYPVSLTFDELKLICEMRDAAAALRPR